MLANVSNNNSNVTETSTSIAPSKIICLPFLLITFLFGLVINTLYLQILCFRMRRNLNVVWFSHLILCNLVFILVIPFLAVMFLFHPHWVLGEFMCKFVNFLISFSMFGFVFFLTVISLDRYWMVFHPHYYRKYVHTQLSSIICLIIWGLALLCSSPYLVFRKVRQESSTSICYNDYTLNGRPDGDLEARVKWAMLLLRLLGGFFIPLGIIIVCYLKIAFKIKIENLTKSRKPFKIIFLAITSFFFSWAPYHIWYGMNIEKGLFQKTTLEALKIFATISTCFNACFTPILYLFIVEKFKTIFKKSMMAILQTALNDAFLRSTDNRLEGQSVSVRRCESQENTL